MGRKLLGIGDEDGHLGGLSFLPWDVEEVDLVLRSNTFVLWSILFIKIQWSLV